jgi:hypothetical protein
VHKSRHALLTFPHFLATDPAFTFHRETAKWLLVIITVISLLYLIPKIAAGDAQAPKNTKAAKGKLSRYFIPYYYIRFSFLNPYPILSPTPNPTTAPTAKRTGRAATKETVTKSTSKSPSRAVSKSPSRKPKSAKKSPQALGTVFSPEGRRSSRANKGMKVMS